MRIGYLPLQLVLPFLLMALITTLNSVAAEELWKGMPTKKIELLKGRLVVEMPKDAIVEPRGHSIMAAPEADELETRVVLESKGAKLVLMARNLESTIGDDFSKNVDRLLKVWDDSTLVRTPGVVTTRGGLKAVLLRSANSARRLEANLVESAIVADNDGTVHFLEVYVNPTAANEWSRVSTIADEILKSATAGSSPIKCESRTVKVDAGLSINAPASSVISTQLGPDFTVFRCSRLRPLGDPPIALSIYAGHHPNFAPDPKTKSSSSKILGHKVDWYTKKSKEGTQFAQGLLPLPDIVLHIMVTGTDDSNLESMKRVAESLSKAK